MSKLSQNKTNTYTTVSSKIALYTVLGWLRSDYIKRLPILHSHQFSFENVSRCSFIRTR